MYRAKVSSQKSTPQDTAYINFIRKEYRRRLAAHRGELGRDDSGEHEQSHTQKAIDFISHHRVVAVALAVLGIVSFIFYASAIISVAAFIGLLVVASLSTFYKRSLGGTPISGFEMVIFGTVISGVAFGPTAGLFFGILSSLASEIISINFGPLTWIYIVTTASIGFLSGIFSGLNIFFLGMAATAITLLVNQVVYLFIGDEDIKGATLFYIIANVTFNVVLFSTLGSRIVSIIS